MADALCPAIAGDAAVPSRLLYPVDEARQLLGGIGRTGFYAAVRSGQIHLIKLGKRSFVAAAEIDRIARGE